MSNNEGTKNDGTHPPPRENETGDGGLLILLDLPAQTTVTLDGAVKCLSRDDFVGVVGFDSSTFHLAVIQPPGSQTGSGGEQRMCHKTGLVIMHRGGKTDHNDTKKGGCTGEGASCWNLQWIMTMRYDPRTEEIHRPSRSTTTDVSDNSLRDLSDAIRYGRMPRHRVCRYDEFVRHHCTPTSEVSVPAAELWRSLVSHVTESILRRRGMHHGDKVIPGTFQDDAGENFENHCNLNTDRVASQESEDGVAVSFPPIPCIQEDESGGIGERIGNGPRVSRISGHIGTKRYLATLSPSERTSLLYSCRKPESSCSKRKRVAGTDPSDSPLAYGTSGGAVLDSVLECYYEGDWRHVVGDVQLAFVLFLYVGCLASFEHWRDLVSMLSLAEGAEQVERHSDLYASVLSTLSVQVALIDADFFDELEFSAGNFFIPAVQRLHRMCSELPLSCEPRSNMVELCTVIKRRFHVDLAPAGAVVTNVKKSRKDGDSDRKSRNIADGIAPGLGGEWVVADEAYMPTIVPEEEVQQAWARCAEASVKEQYRQEIKAEYEEKYPLLFAAKTSQEDTVMACARILDEASDVSLVREAAAYLQEVELNCHQMQNM